MSSGLPVIYSDSGGTPEIVGDAGISLNVENSFEKYHVPKLEDITTGMIKIYKNHIIYSKNARNRAVNNFGIENWLNQHNELFNKLLNYGK